jgi:hypothetical protein
VIRSTAHGAVRNAFRTYTLSDKVYPARKGQLVKVSYLNGGKYAQLASVSTDQHGRWSDKHTYNVTKTYTFRAVSTATRAALLAGSEPESSTFTRRGLDQADDGRRTGARNRPHPDAERPGLAARRRGRLHRRASPPRKTGHAGQQLAFVRTRCGPRDAYMPFDLRRCC